MPAYRAKVVSFRVMAFAGFNGAHALVKFATMAQIPADTPDIATVFRVVLVIMHDPAATTFVTGVRVYTAQPGVIFIFIFRVTMGALPCHAGTGWNCRV